VAGAAVVAAAAAFAVVADAAATTTAAAVVAVVDAVELDTGAVELLLLPHAAKANAATVSTDIERNARTIDDPPSDFERFGRSPERHDA
jgi:hypothetical protein